LRIPWERVFQVASTSAGVESFGQRREHLCDLLRLSFQPIQRRVASSTEGGVTGLTPKRLDLLGMTMLAVANESVDLGIGDPAIPALRVGTGVALGVHAFGGSSPAFHLAPGAHRSRRWVFTDEAVEARRQAGQSSGERGESRRWTVEWMTSPLEEEV
jgi:hypothetical protein